MKFIFLVAVLSQTFSVCAQQIEIICLYGVGSENQLDTRAGTFRHDMISGPDTTIRLTLTDAEKQKIVSFTEAIGFFQYPPVVPFDVEVERTIVDSSTGDYTARMSVWTIQPCGESMLQIVTPQKGNKVTWDNCSGPRDKMLKPLNNLLHMIMDVVKSKPEYKALPRPVGGYQ